MASFITAGNATNGLQVSSDNTGILELKSGTGSGTTAVTIGTGQQVAMTLGSAAAPSITFSGDTDTGIFSPGANTLAFSTNGTEDARFDSAGNFGLGATPSTWGGISGKALDFGAGSIFSTSTGTGQTRVISNAYYNTAWKYKATGGAAMYVCDSGNIAHTWSIAASGSADANITFTQAMTLDASGNLLVNKTATGYINGNNLSYELGAGTAVFGHVNGGGTANDYCAFIYNTSRIGGITQNGASNVSYNTSSDYRLKHDIAPMTGALAKVAALNPVTYKWNADDSAGEGFIAHELQAVVPDCVTGEKDAVDADGNPVYQGIDTSFLVATLTAAIQELKAELDATKAEVAALKGAA
jgi:hypothetical protein